VLAGAGIAVALVLSPSPQPPSFLSATGTASSSGTATASAAAAQAAVFVCTTPASGCTVAHMAQRPAQIDPTAGTAQVVTGLTWTSWGGPQATATGTLHDGSAGGSFPATVTVSDLTRYGSGQEGYASITIDAPAAPVKSFRFTRSTVPG
jgi:hypothetical protein